MSLPQRKPPEVGLQPERTALSWSRTSFGVLGNGALLMLRDVFEFSGPLRLVPAVLAVVVAALTYGVGLQRQRVLRRRPLPDHVTPRVQVRLIGVAVLLLITVTALALPV